MPRLGIAKIDKGSNKMNGIPIKNLLIGFVMIVAAIIGLTINAESLVVTRTKN